jgi:hypothetical protein
MEGPAERNVAAAYGVVTLRQAIIDAQWELTLLEQKHRREQAERGAFTRCPAIRIGSASEDDAAARAHSIAITGSGTNQMGKDQIGN